MRNLCKILGISDSDIARYAGITRQSVFGSPESRRVRDAMADLVLIARLNPEKIERARQVRDELTDFLRDDPQEEQERQEPE